MRSFIIWPAILGLCVAMFIIGGASVFYASQHIWQGKPHVWGFAERIDNLPKGGHPIFCQWQGLDYICDWEEE